LGVDIRSYIGGVFHPFPTMDYRAYTLDDKGHIVCVYELNACDDEDAIAQAQQYVDGHDIEVWQKGRKIGLLSRDAE
jgi:hypothetical protein